MESSVPSRTALRVALRRAAHQIYDSPVIFADPVAIPILGDMYAEELQRTPARPHSVALRAFLVARSRYAEDNLKLAVAAGVDQYVLLGAGLDTFAHRNPYPGLRVFEVDHPATQRWKQEMVLASGLPAPEGLMYAPVDFESQSLSDQLEASGFRPDAPAFFAWLGVVPYLTLAAFRVTLGYLAGRPVGSGVVLDYGQPRAVLSPTEQLAHDSLAGRVELAGEPFQLFFTPEKIAREFAGFDEVEDIGRTEINERYFRERRDQLHIRSSAGRLLCAWRRA